MDMDMAEKWVFNTDANFNNFCGSKDATIEFIVRNRVSMSYGHECFESYQSKGKKLRTLRRFTKPVSDSRFVQFFFIHPV